MFSTDPHDLRGEFLEILAYTDANKRLRETKRLLHLTKEGRIDIIPEVSLPLEEACRLGDTKIIRLYLEHKAAITQSNALEELSIARKQLRKTNKAASHTIKKVIDLALCINEYSEYFNKTSYTGVKFNESLQLACFIANAEGKPYYSKGLNKLPASLLFQKKNVYILYPRLDRTKTHSNLIGGGSYKDVYPALKIRLKSCEVFLAAQLVPNNHQRNFDRPVLTQMHKFADLGQGFPSIFVDTEYFSHKKKGIRQIVIQPLWTGGSLNLHTVHELRKHRSPPLPLNTQINIAACLAVAIRKIHRNNLVHGDIKPHNCLFDGKMKACLTDFDLSYEAGQRVNSWWSKIFYGTVPYVSPEQLETHYSEISSGKPGDMYALGLVLYELFIGKPDWFDRLICHYHKSSVDLFKIRHEYKAGHIGYDDYVLKIINYFSTSRNRKIIVGMQKSLYAKLNFLEKLQTKSREQQYLLMILQLLHPDPAMRLNSDEFFRLSRKLKKSAA